LGAILSQRQDDQEKVIAYASRTLGKPEQKYETTRKELLAIVAGLKQFRQYLLGRHFVIRTDHAALTWLRRTAEPMPQLARWLTSSSNSTTRSNTDPELNTVMRMDLVGE